MAITKNKLFSLLTAFLITFAIFDIGNFEASDLLLGLGFVSIYLLISRRKEAGELQGYAVGDRRSKKINLIISGLWTLSYMIYDWDRMTAGLENKLFVAVYALMATAGIFLALYLMLGLLIPILNVRKADYVADKEETVFSVKKMLIYSGIVFLAMLPLFLMNYPGSMTVDSFDQLRQARNLADYSDHHPWVHTMIIKLFYKLGFAISPNTYFAIGCYVIFQMLVTALSVGYAAAVIRQYKKRIWSLIVILAFVLYPYHLAYAITIWKDILFADMVLVFTATLYSLLIRIRHKKISLSTLDYVLLFISGLGMCLIRHNGLYAYIVTGLIIICMAVMDYRKKSDKSGGRLIGILVLFVLTLGLALVIKGPVEKGFKVEKGDYAHNLAIPLQQLGRTVAYGGDISEEDLAKLEKINSITYIYNNYEPGGADNMIQWLAAGDETYFNEHRMEYLGIWLRIGAKNPIAYLQAYTDQTKGYYTSMMPEQIAYYGILPNKDGLENQPLLGAGIRIKIDELCSKIQNMIPVYGIYYSMGACLMLLILWLAIAGLKGESYLITVALPVLTLTGTILIATPLVADLRYAYPLMLCFPALTAMFLGSER